MSCIYPEVDNNYKVFVRCPVFNHKPYLLDALNGFTKQKTNFQYVVTIEEDFSTDGTRELLEKYINEECTKEETTYFDSDTSSIVRTKSRSNQNCSLVIYFFKFNHYSRRTNRDRYLKPWREHCEYEAMCEGDDYWINDNKLQIQVDFLDHHADYGMCYMNCNVYYQESKKTLTDLLTRPGRQSEFNSLEEYIISRAYLAPPTWLYRTALQPSQTQKVISVDGTFVYFAYFLAHTKIKFINQTTAVYRVLEESACHSKSYEKEYAREKNLLSVQLSLCEQYSLPKDISRRCEIEHYRHNLKRFMIHDKMEDVRIARKMIEKKTFQEKILFAISSSKTGRRLLRFVYNNLRKIK